MMKHWDTLNFFQKIIRLLSELRHYILVGFIAEITMNPGNVVVSIRQSIDSPEAIAFRMFGERTEVLLDGLVMGAFDTCQGDLAKPCQYSTP
jgi:hypothetical protein